MLSFSAENDRMRKLTVTSSQMRNALKSLSSKLMEQNTCG
jgi:hypothetical protein